MRVFSRMKFRGRSSLVGWMLGLMLAGALVSSNAFSDVRVYGEGSYTESEVDVSILADITTGDLKSFGVKLTYDALNLRVLDAWKAEDVWYFGVRAHRRDPPTDDVAHLGLRRF